MDGGDGAGNTGGTSDGGAGVIGFGGMGTPPMFGGSGTSGIGGKNKPFSPQTVPSWHRTAAGAPEEAASVAAPPGRTEPTTATAAGACFRPWRAARWPWNKENATSSRSRCEPLILESRDGSASDLNAVCLTWYTYL